MNKITVNSQAEFDQAWADPETYAVRLAKDIRVTATGNSANKGLFVIAAGKASVSLRQVTAGVVASAEDDAILHVYDSPTVSVSYKGHSTGSVDGVLGVSAAGYAVIRVAEAASVINVSDRAAVTVAGLNGQQVWAKDFARVYASGVSDARIWLYDQAFAKLPREAAYARVYAYHESTAVAAAGSVWAAGDSTVTVDTSHPRVIGTGRARIRQFPKAARADITTVGQASVAQIIQRGSKFRTVFDWARAVGAEYDGFSRVVVGYVAADSRTGQSVYDGRIDLTVKKPFDTMGDNAPDEVPVYPSAAEASREPGRAVYKVIVSAKDVTAIIGTVLRVSRFEVVEEVDL